MAVENYHLFGRGYLASRNKMSRDGICDPDLRTRLIKTAIAKVSAQYQPHDFFSQPLEFFSEEIRWIAQHGLFTFDDYVAAERIGRSGARITRELREIIYKIYQHYLEGRTAVGKLYDWDDLSAAVCSEFENDPQPRRYRHVVIDEGQDFSPQMIRSLARAVPQNGSLTFFGDMAQQIYGHRMSWRSAGLNIARVWEFTENYRNTKQIARLALAISRMPPWTNHKFDQYGLHADLSVKTRQGCARPRRPRARVCLRKGCERQYQPRRWNQRYCQDADCLRQLRRWQAAQRQARRRQDDAVKAKHAAAERQRRQRLHGQRARRQPAPVSAQASDQAEVAAARGHAAKSTKIFCRSPVRAAGVLRISPEVGPQPETLLRLGLPPGGSPGRGPRT